MTLHWGDLHDKFEDQTKTYWIECKCGWVSGTCPDMTVVIEAYSTHKREKRDYFEENDWP